MKNTAAAIISAALCLEENYPNSKMLVWPSDHKIIDWEIFQECIYQGFEFIKKGKRCPFGIKPNRSETAFGYLEIQRNQINTINKGN